MRYIADATLCSINNQTTKIIFFIIFLFTGNSNNPWQARYWDRRNYRRRSSKKIWMGGRLSRQRTFNVAKGQTKDMVAIWWATFFNACKGIIKKS